MAYLRFNALSTVNSRTAVPVTPPSAKISDFFGTNVFGADAMKKYMSGGAFKVLMNSIETGRSRTRRSRCSCTPTRSRPNAARCRATTSCRHCSTDNCGAPRSSPSIPGSSRSLPCPRWSLRDRRGARRRARGFSWPSASVSCCPRPTTVSSGIAYAICGRSPGRGSWPLNWSRSAKSSVRVSLT